MWKAAERMKKQKKKTGNKDKKLRQSCVNISIFHKIYIYSNCYSILFTANLIKCSNPGDDSNLSFLSDPEL